MTPRPLPYLRQFNLAGAMAEPAWPPRLMQGVAPLHLAQFWRRRRERGFRSGHVWLATTGTAFVVFAELIDDSIHTLATGRNQPLWDLGDVFEIFLRHTDRPDYFEFHVAPNGFTTELHYPVVGASRVEGVDRYLLPKRHFRAMAFVPPGRRRWRVGATIPIAGLVPKPLRHRASTWMFSFSRYDCTPGQPPVVSSSSRHRKPDFHQAAEWTPFRFSVGSGTHGCVRR